MRRGTEWRWLSLCLATAYPHPQDPMSQNHSSCLKTNPHILKHHKTGLHIPKPGPTSQNQTLCPKTTLPVSKPVSKSPNQPMPIDPTRTENCCVTPPSTQQGDIALPAVLMEDPPPPYLALRDMVLSPGHIQRSALPPTTASVITEGTCGNTDGLGTRGTEQRYLASGER